MKETIFIVDDMGLILQSMKYWLEVEGFDSVICFQNPLLALEQVRSGLVPSVVIADYDMPGLDGVTLLDLITDLHPNVRGIIVSGSRMLSEVPDKYPVIDKAISHFFQNLATLVEEGLGKRRMILPASEK